MPDSAAEWYVHLQTIAQENEWRETSVLLEKVGGPWKPLILYYISEGVHEYREIRRLMMECDKITYGRQLMELEDAELIEKSNVASAPPKDYYHLTQQGRKYLPLYETLFQYTLACKAEDG
ncbi:MAG: helix-turn-helix domain-containing protein [Bacteroidota bacterium]